MHLTVKEQKIMMIIWRLCRESENGTTNAKAVSDLLVEKYGWTRSTNYVYFTRLLSKGAITREYPSYTIKPLFKENDYVMNTLNDIIDESFGGSLLTFFEYILDIRNIDTEDAKLIDECFKKHEDKLDTQD